MFLLGVAFGLPLGILIGVAAVAGTLWLFRPRQYWRPCGRNFASYR